MKAIKRVMALVLALALSLSISAIAFAAPQTGSVTVENATIGKEYKGYKIFDATWSGDAVAYTIKSDNPWYPMMDEESDNAPFTLTPAVGLENTFTVKRKTGVTDADIITWLKGRTLPAAVDLATKTATTNTVSWADVPYGYYYITSSLGTIVTITNHNGDVTIRDKNQSPKWDPEDPKNPGENPERGKFVKTAPEDEYTKTSTASIDGTAYFKINAFVPKFSGASQVHTYTFVDTLDQGFTYNDDLALAIDGTERAEGTDYDLTVNGQIITVKLKASAIANYPVEGHMSITFTATVDDDAVYDNKNTSSMTWTLVNPADPDNPTNPNPNDPDAPKPPANSVTDTYVYGFNLQKYKTEAAAGNELAGAKFALYDSNTGGTRIDVVLENGVYRVAQEGEDGVDILAGTAAVFGLKEGTYYLEEIEAPNGYNPLTERKAVVVGDAVDNGVNETGDGYTDALVTIVNSTGIVLPTTGDMGTTIFYVLGGLLMLGAVVFLAAKKIMNAEKKQEKING